MIREIIRPINFGELDQEEWSDYLERNRFANEEVAKLEFYRQVVFDHFDHHNDFYPSFEIDDFTYEIRSLSVRQVNDCVRFFDGESLCGRNWWGNQYDEFAKKNVDYVIYQEMSKNHTPPFPPVLLDSTSWRNIDGPVLGGPLHLIEGNHRVSYLLHMAEKEIIGWDSEHAFVVLTKA